MKLIHYSNSKEVIISVKSGTGILINSLNGLYLYPELSNNTHYGLDRDFIHVFSVDENSESVLLSNDSPEKIEVYIKKLIQMFPDFEWLIKWGSLKVYSTKWLINAVKNAETLYNIKKEEILIKLGITAIIDISYETRAIGWDHHQESLEAIVLKMDCLTLIEIRKNKE